LSKFSAQNKNTGNNRFSQAVVPSKNQDQQINTNPKPKPPTNSQKAPQNSELFAFYYPAKARN
jgi:hypothetical protein